MAVGTGVGGTTVAVGCGVGGTAVAVGIGVGGTAVAVGRGVGGTAVAVGTVVGGTAVAVGRGVGGTAVVVGRGVGEGVGVGRPTNTRSKSVFVPPLRYISLVLALVPFRINSTLRPISAVSRGSTTRFR